MVVFKTLVKLLKMWLLDYPSGYVLHFVLISGVENSFPDRDIRMKFLQKYYQLLCHKKFPMKEPKLVLVGAPDSGKTSWIFPFYGEFLNKK